MQTCGQANRVIIEYRFQHHLNMHLPQDVHRVESPTGISIRREMNMELSKDHIPTLIQTTNGNGYVVQGTHFLNLTA